MRNAKTSAATMALLWTGLLWVGLFWTSSAWAARAHPGPGGDDTRAAGVMHPPPFRFEPLETGDQGIGVWKDSMTGDVLIRGNLYNVRERPGPQKELEDGRGGESDGGAAD